MPLATLEEIRLLSNLETGKEKLLQIVLFGQPELDEHLNLPHMRQLKERITHAFGLAPLPPRDIKDYIDFRLRAAGYHGPDLFGPEVLRIIADASEGLTRRINIYADKTLLAAFAAGTHTVSADHARAAVSDTQIVVTPQSLAAAGRGRRDRGPRGRHRDRLRGRAYSCRRGRRSAGDRAARHPARRNAGDRRNRACAAPAAGGACDRPPRSIDRPPPRPQARRPRRIRPPTAAAGGSRAEGGSAMALESRLFRRSSPCWMGPRAGATSSS